MKETFKNVANKVKTTGKKAIVIAKKNPAVAATGFAIVTIGVCNVMKKARNNNKMDDFANAFNRGVDSGATDAILNIANYLSGKTGTPFKDVKKELEENVGNIRHKIVKA